MKIYEYKPLNMLLANLWYTIVGLLDRKKEILTMNYGYHLKQPIHLDPSDERYRHSLQLYHFVTQHVEIAGKDILEIGCGRGGGASYITRYLHPRSYIGCDLTKKSIDFNKKQYKNIPNLSFIQGNAHALPFQNESCDVVINVETSHHYKDFPRFLAESKRVLRSNGYLLLTDYRETTQIQTLDKAITESGFQKIIYKDITADVVKALELDSAEHERLVETLAPKMLWSVAKDFSGVKGSDLFNSFNTKEWTYFFYVLQKK